MRDCSRQQEGKLKVCNAEQSAQVPRKTENTEQEHHHRLLHTTT